MVWEEMVDVQNVTLQNDTLVIVCTFTSHGTLYNTAHRVILGISSESAQGVAKKGYNIIHVSPLSYCPKG